MISVIFKDDGSESEVYSFLIASGTHCVHVQD